MTDSVGSAPVYGDIDELLGCAEGRFFGAGHRKVTHTVGSLAARTDDNNVDHVQGKATIDYPADWSVKGRASGLRLHLSSIDALVLAAHLAEYHLAQNCRLDADQRRRAWLRSVTMTAGTAPQLELTDFDIRARVGRAEPTLPSIDDNVSIVDCRIGPMKVRCEVEHEAGIRAVPEAVELCSVGSGYQQTGREIRAVRADRAVGCVEGLVKVVYPAGGKHADGLGAAYLPALTPVDALVVSAQLAQVLLYGMDDVDRGHTDTMWLRRLTMTLPTPYQPITNAFTASMSALKSRLVTLDGNTWRTADVVADLLGIHVLASIAHTLPDRARAGGGRTSAPGPAAV